MLGILPTLGVEHIGYTLGGLRGGGACYHYLKTFMPQVLHRQGRRKADSSLEQSLQVGVSMLSVSDWSPAVLGRILRLARLLPTIARYWLARRHVRYM